MNKDKYITPYIAPALDDNVSEIMVALGRKIRLKKKEYVFRQNIINSFVYVKSGMLGRIRDTPLLSKQTHLEIIPPNRVANFINFFSPGRVRISLLSLRNSEVYIVPFEKIYAVMERDEAFRNEVNQMYGANAESSLRSCHCNFIFPCKYRLLLFFKALARHSNTQPDLSGWVQLPYKLTREEYCQVIFCSLLTLDNTFLEWKKRNLYKKTKEGSFVHVSLLEKDIMLSIAEEEEKVSHPAHLHRGGKRLEYRQLSY